MSHTKRTLSFTEISASQTCQAKWDFPYGGRLAGTALKPKAPAGILREGRAWGAAAAAWHAEDGLLAPWAARKALSDTIIGDVEQIRGVGGPVDIGEAVAMQERLFAMLGHYTEPRRKTGRRPPRLRMWACR